jgi:hypothetical protein
MSENPENKVVLEPHSAERGSYCLTPAKAMCHVKNAYSLGVLGSIGANYETDPFDGIRCPGTVKANVLRKDLIRSGKGNGCHGN